MAAAPAGFGESVVAAAAAVTYAADVDEIVGRCAACETAEGPCSVAGSTPVYLAGPLAFRGKRSQE